MFLTITKPLSMAVALFAGVFVCACASAQRNYTPPPPPLTTAPCVPTKKSPCDPPPSEVRPADAKNPFPFPGEDTPNSTPAPPASQPAFPFPGEADSAKPADPPNGAQKAFPFPGEAETPPPAASSSSSSSSPTDSTPDEPALKDEGSTGSTRFARKHLPKVEDTDTREAKDLEVSRYYASTGNFQAAYLRAKDAVTTIPDDPAAHFALAQNAERLKKTDEAIAEYNAYLKLEPDGDKVKQARRSLAALSHK